MRRKKVLFISAGIFPIPANKGGAVEELIDTFTENNAKEGRYEISVASCVFKGREIKAKTKGVKYYYFRMPFYLSLADKMYYLYVDRIEKDWRSMFRQYCFRNRHYIKKITETLDLKAYDAVIVENNMSLLEKLSEVMGEEFERKCMYHMHSNLVDNEEMIPYLARCRKILAVSDYVKDHLYQTVPQLQNTEVVKVTNGIRGWTYSKEERQSLREQMRDRYHVGEEETIYLFAGRVSPEKGVLEMTRAFRAVLPRLRHKSRLFIVGSASSGSDKESYYYRAVKKEAAQSPESIILTGYINHEDVAKYHVMADAQIVPSIMDDPAPLTVLEGMSMGNFLLLSKAGGIPEYSANYSNKIFFERGDSFEKNIRDAFLSYDQDKAPHRYENSANHFGEERYYRELAEAVDVS
ncbi:MAG TPA: glycosyltransferase family 4 protein [Candidatus Dorea faecipullorum]|nr:glycosyltransferase family 4 protein [Candidatus Dorea faecipullorum]